MTTSTIGGRLAAALRLKKATPADIARAAETSEATISNWINNRVQVEHVKALQLFRIADAASIDPKELLLGEPLRVAETRASYPSHPVNHDLLTIAIQLVEEELEKSDRALPPAKRAEAIHLAYDLLEEGMPRAKVLRFVLAAVA